MPARLSGLKFKSNNIIKSKAMKFIVKKYGLTSNNGNILHQLQKNILRP